MSLLLVAGAILMSSAAVRLFVLARSGGTGYEFAGAWVLQSLGASFVAAEVIPPSPIRLVVVSLAASGVLVGIVLYWRLVRQEGRREQGTTAK